MNPWHDDDRATIYHGDCLDVLRQLPDASVDSVVTDPPYGLEFMGKDWDKFKTGRGAAYSSGGAMSTTDFKNLGTLPQYVSRPAKRCGICGKQAWSGSPCKCPEPHWVMDNSPLHSFQAWAELWAAECRRVLKPGGHLLAFGGTRTWHRLAVAIEDAGFEIRDSIAWMYGSGFPKSLDVSKAIDKVNGEGDRLYKFTAWMRTTGLTARELNDATGTFMGSHYLTAKSQPAIPTPDLWALIRPLCGQVPDWVDELVERIEAEREVIGTKTSGIADKNEGPRHTIGASKAVLVDITAPATPDAARWQGWGTALKPAHEPIVVARKPLIGTVAANVLEHGTGALNIDGCRIEGGQRPLIRNAGNSDPRGEGFHGKFGSTSEGTTTAGRWPANVVLDEDQAAALDQQTGDVKGAVSNGKRAKNGDGPAGIYCGTAPQRPGYADTGGASRFFYVAKAPARERPKVDGTAHPTVKPLTLMRWLCRLVTPPDGVVLEPFAGSGTTIEAALLEGFRIVAIEREADYLPLIQARLDRVAEETDGQLTLDASA